MNQKQQYKPHSSHYCTVLILNSFLLRPNLMKNKRKNARELRLFCKLHAEFQNKRSRLLQPTYSSVGVAYLSNVSAESDDLNTDG